MSLIARSLGRLGILDALALSAVLLGWRFFTGSPLNTRTALTVAGLYSVLRILQAVQNAAKETGTAPAGDTGAKRVFVKDPAQVLDLAKIEGYEAIRRSTPYLDKWLTISGAFEGRAESLRRDSMYVSLILDDGRRVNLRFAGNKRAEIQCLQQGQRITANCQIRHYDFALRLENCELVDTEPFRRASFPKVS